jgi:hypothetical protein
MNKLIPILLIILIILAIPIMLVLVLTTSYADNRKIWIQEYQITKCTWAETEADFKKDSIANSAKYIIKLTEIKTEIKEIEKPIHSEIQLLNHKIGQINIKYLNKSRKISDEQERTNGHNSTPEYENRMEENDKNNNREVLALENEKAVLQLKLNENKTLQELFLKQKKMLQQIASETSVLQEKYKTTFDSLKNKLDNQNNNFKMMLEDLDNSEKERFKSQREIINSNPCK